MYWERHADQIRTTVKRIEDSCAKWPECVFRGEPKRYDRPCCSTLWREYACSEVLGIVGGTPEDSRTQLMSSLDFGAVQAQIVHEAREYSGDLNDEVDLVTYLRHHGAPTNLIDFTSSLHVALFFACNDCEEEDGYVYVQDAATVHDRIRRPRNLNRRATAQRSVFIESPFGFIDPPHHVMITKDIKADMLRYLNLLYGISAKTVYYDLNGFIQNYSIRKSLHDALRSAMRYGVLNDLSHRSAATNVPSNYDQLIIDSYGVVLTYDPTNYIAYNSRGTAFHNRGDYDKSISDFGRAVELFPSDQSYSNLGMSHFRKGEYRESIAYLSKAIECSASDRLYVLRGDAYYRDGDYDKAEVDYMNANEKELLNIVSRNWNLIAAYKLAILRLKTTAYDASLEVINDVIEHDTDSCLGNRPYCVRGIVLLCLKEWDSAVEDLSRCRDNDASLDCRLNDDFQTISSFIEEVGIALPPQIVRLLQSRAAPHESSRSSRGQSEHSVK